MRRLRHGCAIMALLAAIGCAPRPAGPAPPAHGVPAIDTLALRAHSWFLAHDRLAGRATGSAGAALAGHYVAAQCRALGLTVRELPVPVAEATVEAESTMLQLDGVAYRFARDFVLGGGTGDALRGFTGTVRWVGSSDDILAAGDRLPDLQDAVALTAGPLRPAAAGRLHARRAAGMIHLLADPETFARYRASRGAGVMYVADPAVPSSFHPALPSIIAGPELSRALLAAAARAARVALALATTRHPVSAFNVSCDLPGADPARRDGRIAFTAHYDHLGVSEAPDGGDSIYNGFSDNAAGVAMLLAIARALRDADPPPRHTMQFLFFSGEERGLLGSDYYVRHPVTPLEDLLAVVNLDAGAPPARPWSWRLAGGDASPLGAIARDVAASRGWTATTSPATANSDYFPFVREGVPAVFIIPGPGPYEGLTADSSEALRRRWDRYHRPDDEWHPDFPFEGLARYAEYALLVALAVDRAPGRIGIR